jgi:hypothetical protein
MNGNEKHSVLLNFSGRDYELYMVIAKESSKHNLPVSTYMRLLLRAGLTGDITIKKNEVAENHSEKE